jgi:hypothetical protein
MAQDFLAVHLTEKRSLGEDKPTGHRPILAYPKNDLYHWAGGRTWLCTYGVIEIVRSWNLG